MQVESRIHPRADKLGERRLLAAVDRLGLEDDEEIAVLVLLWALERSVLVGEHEVDLVVGLA